MFLTDRLALIGREAGIPSEHFNISIDYIDVNIKSKSVCLFHYTELKVSSFSLSLSHAQASTPPQPPATHTHIPPIVSMYPSPFLSLFVLSLPFLEYTKSEHWNIEKKKNAENANNRVDNSYWQHYMVPDSPDAKPCHSQSQQVAATVAENIKSELGRYPFPSI